MFFKLAVCLKVIQVNLCKFNFIQIFFKIVFILNIFLNIVLELLQFLIFLGENIADCITKALEEWNIHVPKTPLFMVSDNAANMTKAGELL